MDIDRIADRVATRVIEGSSRVAAPITVAVSAAADWDFGTIYVSTKTRYDTLAQLKNDIKQMETLMKKKAKALIKDNPDADVEMDSEVKINNIANKELVIAQLFSKNKGAELV